MELNLRLLGVIVVIICILLSFTFIEKYTPIITYMKPNNDGLIIVPPFKQDAFKSAKGDQNEYLYDKNGKKSFIGQAQRPIDTLNPKPFMLF